jgi:hypothetical protein
VREIIEFAHKESGIGGKPEAKFFSLYTYEEYEEKCILKDFPTKLRVRSQLLSVLIGTPFGNGAVFQNGCHE